MYMVLVRMKSRGNEQFSLIGLGYKNICKYQLVMKVNLDNNPLYCICMAAYKYNTQYNTIQYNKIHLFNLSNRYHISDEFGTWAKVI